MKNVITKFALLTVVCLLAVSAFAQQKGSSSVSILINPVPTGTISGKNPVCPERVEAYTLTNLNDGIPAGSKIILDPAYNPAWEVVKLDGAGDYGGTLVGTPDISGATFTFYNNTNDRKKVAIRVHLKNDISNCTNFVDDTIYISPRPTLKITGLDANQILCSGRLNTYTIDTVDGTNGALFDKWVIEGIDAGVSGSFTGAATINPATVYFNNTGTSNGKARIIVYYSNECGQYTDSIEVWVKPNPALTITAPTLSAAGQACSEQPYSFSLDGLLGADATFTSWRSSTVTGVTVAMANSTAATTTMTFNNTTNAPATVTIYADYVVVDAANGNCLFTDSIQIPVHPRPQMTIAGLADGDELCSGISNRYTIKAENSDGKHKGAFVRWEFAHASSSSITCSVMTPGTTNSNPATVYFRNSSNVNGAIYIVAVYKDDDNATSGCDGEYRDSIQVTVKPGTDVIINSADLLGATTACSDRNYTLKTSATNPANAVFTGWTTGVLPASVTVTFTPASAETTTVYFANRTQANQTVWVYANYSDENGCGFKDSLQVTILPRPDMDIEGSNTACANVPVTYSTSNAFNATFVSWTVEPASAASVGTTSGTDNTATIVYYNETDSDIKVKLILTYSDAVNSCGNYTDTLEVTVTPRPRINITVDGAPTAKTSICSAGTLSLATNPVHAAFVSWTAVPVNGDAALPSGISVAFAPSSVTSPATATFTNATSASYTVGVVATYQGTGACGSETYRDTVYVSIYPQIVIDLVVVTSGGEEDEYAECSTTTDNSANTITLKVTVTGGCPDAAGYVIEWASEPAGITPLDPDTATLTLTNAEAAAGKKFTVKAPANNTKYNIDIKSVIQTDGGSCNCTWTKQ